jgi:hypothetical protein
MSVHEFQELTGRSIERHWIRCGADAVERVLAVLVCNEFSSEIVIILVMILLLVET